MGNDFAVSRTQRATKCTGLARALLMWTFARKVCKISPLHFVFLATHVMSDKHLVKSILSPLVEKRRTNLYMRMTFHDQILVTSTYIYIPLRKY